MTGEFQVRSIDDLFDTKRQKDLISAYFNVISISLMTQLSRLKPS